MKSTIKQIGLLIPVLALLFFASCGDDVTEAIDDPIDDPIEDTEEIVEIENPEANALLQAAYDRLRAATFNNQGHMFALQEFAGDLAVLPARGADWFDNGKWHETHQHNWNPDQKHIEEGWTDMFTGMTESIVALNAFEGLDNPVRFKLAESKALTAFYMFNLFDLFSKVPYDRNLTGTFEILEGQDAIDEIVSLLTEAEGDLVLGGGASSVRMTKGAVWALLAKVYLNKAVFLNRYGVPNFETADMDSVMKYSDLIIESGVYSLETDYFRMFDVQNEDNSEFIFAVEQFNNLGEKAFGRNDLASNTLGRNQKLSPEDRGSNGGALTPDFVNTWDVTDPRFFELHLPQEEGTIAPADYTALNRGLLMGQQYGAVLNEAGDAFLADENGNLLIQALVIEKDPSLLMNFTNSIVFNSGPLNQGVRCSKYEYDMVGGRSIGGFNIPLFRLAEIYLMRAEAALRGASSGSALLDVNTVRQARLGQAASGTETLDALGTVTLDVLLQERGFELYWEHYRRTDLIRFGKFEDSWTEKTDSDVNKRVYPIFSPALATIPGLTQNQGY